MVLREPVVPVHDDRVRPYRPIPIFHSSTIVQHYLKAEEMKPFYKQALESAAAATAGGSTELDALKQGTGQTPPEQLYSTLVQMGLLRR